MVGDCPWRAVWPWGGCVLSALVQEGGSPAVVAEPSMVGTNEGPDNGEDSVDMLDML